MMSLLSAMTWPSRVAFMLGSSMREGSQWLRPRNVMAHAIPTRGKESGIRRRHPRDIGPAWLAQDRDPSDRGYVERRTDDFRAGRSRPLQPRVDVVDRHVRHPLLG